MASYHSPFLQPGLHERRALLEAQVEQRALETLPSILVLDLESIDEIDGSDFETSSVSTDEDGYGSDEMSVDDEVEVEDGEVDELMNDVAPPSPTRSEKEVLRKREEMDEMERKIAELEVAEREVAEGWDGEEFVAEVRGLHELLRDMVILTLCSFCVIMLYLPLECFRMKFCVFYVPRWGCSGLMQILRHRATGSYTPSNIRLTQALISS